MITKEIGFLWAVSITSTFNPTRYRHQTAHTLTRQYASGGIIVQSIHSSSHLTSAVYHGIWVQFKFSCLNVVVGLCPSLDSRDGGI